MNSTTQNVAEGSGNAESRVSPANPKPQKEIPCEVLNAGNYAEWDALVDRSTHGTVFHYSWWLQVTAKEFVILATRNEKGALVAGLPVAFRPRPHGKAVEVPALTPYLGPIFDLSQIDNTCDQLHFMRTHGEALASSLAPFDNFQCVIGPRFPDLQGFLWMGFQASLSYTECLPSGCSVDQILNGMSEADREELENALRLNLNVSRDDGIEDLLFLNHTIAQRHGNKASCPPNVVNLLWSAAGSQARAHLYVARTNDKTPVAALLAVHDNHDTYQILSTAHPEFEAIPALRLISWTALQDSLLARRGYQFIHSAGPYHKSACSQWGATPVPTWRLEKADSWRAGLFRSFADHRRPVSTHP